MADTVHCAMHGERREAFACTHLASDGFGLGFNRNEPSDDDPFPDAWCDNCELIRVAHDGWTDESQKLANISLLCSSCYERARIRNTRTPVTLGDLADLRWKCGSCDEWHHGPCLDFGYDAPDYWKDEHQAVSASNNELGDTFLTDDYCAIENEDFFVRGVIELPIIGTSETFNWGVWGSLSRENFEKLLETNDDPKRVELPPMFSWLSSSIPEYPDTLNLKMYAQAQEGDLRPTFELERNDHPLSREYHEGITPERVKEIMMGRLQEDT